MVELHRSIHAVSSGEPWHRRLAAMLVADCASEALTTEDELRRGRSGVQCEAQASLSALRRELPPASWLLLSSCGFCCSSTLCLGFRTCACTFDPRSGFLGGSLSEGPLLRPGLLRTWLHPPELNNLRATGTLERDAEAERTEADGAGRRGWRPAKHEAALSVPRGAAGFA